MMALGLVLVVGFAFVGLRTFTEVEPVDFFLQLDHMWLAISVALFVFGNLLVGHRFMALYPERKKPLPGPFTVGSLFFSGNVFTLLLPGPVGELAAIAILRRRYGLPMRDSFAVTVHTRFVGLFSAAVVAAVALPFVNPEGLLGQVLLTCALVLTVGGLGLGMLGAQPAWLRRFGNWVLSVMDHNGPGPVRWVVGRTGAQIRLFAESLTRVWHGPFSSWLKVVMWSFVIQGVHLASLVAATQALSVEPAWPGLLLAQGMGSLTILIVFLVPGGLGAYELAVISSLSGPGALPLIDAGMAALCFRVVHLSGLACAGIGFLAWARGFMAPEVIETMKRGRLEEEE